MNATRRMKWYWSGGMIGILIILLALLKLFGGSSALMMNAHLLLVSMR